MSTIDASIPLGVKPVEVESPANAMIRALQIQGLQQQRESGQMEMQDKATARERQNRLYSILGQDHAKPEDREAALLRGGYVDQAAKLAKDRRDNAKTDAETQAKGIETAHKRMDLMGQVLGWVRQNPTMENATAAVQHLVSNGAMPPEKAQEAIAKFQANPTPQAIAAFADMGFRAALAAKDQLPKIETRNLGGTTDTLSTDPVSGQSSVVNSAQNTQSPDNAASQATAIRGQNMVDARSRDSLAATITKPFEITGEDGKPVLVQQDKQGNIKPVQGYGPKQGASKPLTDTQAKALQFGSRMQAAEETLGELSGKGVITSIPGSRGGFGVGSTINALQPADRQRLDQAKRDFINAVLRRESGAAISSSEFENAEQQYFPQVGEKDPKVLEQKKRNRELATRGILAEVPDSENRVAKVRGVSAPAGVPDMSAIDAELARRQGGK